MDKAEEILEKHINEDDLNFIFHEKKDLWRELLNATNEALGLAHVVATEGTINMSTKDSKTEPRTLKDRAFAALTNDVNDWKIDKYNAYHKPSGIKWWIANGLLFFHAEGNKDVSIGLWNWIRLYYWIKNAKRQQVIDSVYGNNVPQVWNRFFTD